MKKFIVGFLSVFMMLGASILYACTETVELEMSTQTISIQLNSDVEDPSATIYANITGTDDKTLNWSLLEKNDVIEDVEISQLSDGRTAITIEAQNVGKNDIVFTTAHGGVQKTVHVEVYTEVTKILNKPEDVETKSSRFLVKGQTSTLVGADYFTFEPSSSDRTQVSWTFEANGTTSYNGAEIVGDQITLPRQFDGSVVLRATTHLGVSQTVSIACIDPIDISLIDIGGAKTKTGVFEYISSGEVAVEITPNISGDTFENLAYLAVKFSGEVTSNFGGLDLQALVYNEDGSLLSIGSQNVDGSTERLLKVDSDSQRQAQDGSIEYIFKVRALENRNINDVFFVAFNIGYKNYNYHISSDELGFGRIKVNAKEKIQKVSVTKDEIDASNEMQYLYSNYASSMNGGFGQLFEVGLTPKSVTQASGQIVLSVSTNGLGLHSNLSPVLAYTRSSGAYSEIGLEWDPNSSAFVSQPISSTLTDPLKHQIYLKANPDFFTAENEAGNPDSSFRGIGISFASVDNPKATQANMSVCVVKSSGSIEFETAVDQIKIDSSSVATISQTGLPDKIITFIDPKLKVGLLDYQNFQFATGFWIQTTGDLNIDTNSDGEISLAEAYPIYDVRCQGVGISSVDDIQNFPNVRTLFCNNNVITSIDLSNHKGIGGLHCYNNRIESLNVSNTNIHTLNCYENYIANLDISNCYNLYNINCDYNNIQSLDLTNCAQLQFLSLRNNPITSLTLSRCTNLAALSVGKDGITIPKLDLSGLAKLQTIICMGEVSSLIIGPEHSALTSLGFSTDKSTFDCSFCDNLSLLGCSDSPNLSILHLPKNIKILYISRCNFQQLDLSNCLYLEELECASNKIQELDLSNCPYLKKVNVLDNPIKTIWLKEGQNVEIVKNSNSDIEIKYKN